MSNCDEEKLLYTGVNTGQVERIFWKMHFIERLPFILGILAALTVGMLSFDTGISQQAIYIRMVVSLLIFYFIGLYARATILKIHNEIQSKETGENQKPQDQEERAASVIDTRIADDFDFEPLKVSKILNTLNNTSTKDK